MYRSAHKDQEGIAEMVQNENKTKQDTHFKHKQLPSSSTTTKAK